MEQPSSPQKKRKLQSDHSAAGAKRPAITSTNPSLSGSVATRTAEFYSEISGESWLELALAENWLALRLAINQEYPPLTDLELVSSRVKQGPHKGKNIFSLLAYHKKWELIHVIVEDHPFGLTLEEPPIIEGPDYDPGKNFPWLLAFHGQWRLLEKIVWSLPPKAISSQAQTGLGQGTNVLWHLAFWGRGSIILDLIRESKLPSNALNSQALTGIAQGKNVMALLVEHGQWLVIAELINRNIVNHTDQLQNSKVILGLATQNKWLFIQLLITKGLVTPAELAQYNRLKENVLFLLVEHQQWALIDQLLLNKLLTAEHLTRRNILGKLVKSFPRLIIDFLNMNLITQTALCFGDEDPSNNILSSLATTQQLNLIISLIDKGLITNSMLKDNTFLCHLIEQQNWEIIEKLMNNHLLTPDILEEDYSSDDDENDSEGILGLIASAKPVPWELLESLIANKLITTKALNAESDAGETFWSHIDFSNVGNEEDADDNEEEEIENRVIFLAKRKILRALIEQGLLNSETLQIQIKTKDGYRQNLLSTIFDIFIKNSVEVDSGLFELLIPQITTQLLLESTTIESQPYLSQDSRSQSFLIKLLTNRYATRFIPLLLASDLQPLNAVPWQVFRRITPALMVWFWRERRINKTFSQLCALGITLPTNTELALFLTPAEQIAWLTKGGPNIALSDYPGNEQFIDHYLPRGEISYWLKGGFSMVFLKDIIKLDKTPTESLKIACLKFGGTNAFNFLNQHKISLPSFTEVAPFMSEPSVYDWLLHGNLVLFEMHFLVNHAPLLPLHIFNNPGVQKLFTSVRMIKIQNLYKKYFRPTIQASDIERPLIGPAITDFSPSDQAIYWQTQIQNKIRDLFINFAFRAADMETHATLHGSAFPKTVMNIIFSYLLDLSDTAISHYLFQKKYPVPITSAAMSQALIFTDQYQKLISEATDEGESLYLFTAASQAGSALAMLGHSKERDKVREDSEIAADWKATKVDSNSAFHAIFGLWDAEKNQYICENVLEKRHNFPLLSFEKIYNSQPHFDCNVRKVFRKLLLHTVENNIAIKGESFIELRKAYNEWQHRIELAWQPFESLLKKNQAAIHHLEEHWHLPKVYSADDTRPTLREVVTRLQKQGLLHQQSIFKKILDSDQALAKSYLEYVRLVSPEYFRIPDSQNCFKEYLQELTNLHRSILPQELVFIAFHYDLHIICHLPHAKMLIFNDSSTDVIEIWYDGRYFLREPKPGSLHLYRTGFMPPSLPGPSLPLPAPAPPEICSKDEKALSATPVTWKPTVGDGDCAFHAIFGDGHGLAYYCTDAYNKRVQLAKAIVDSFPVRSSSSSPSTASIVYRLSITGIAALVMDEERPLTGRLLDLRRIYRHWCEQRNELDVAWAQLEIALQANSQALNFLATQHNLGKLRGLTDSQVLRAQLQNICQRPIVGGLQEIVSQDSALQSSYQAYQLQQSRNRDQDFDWHAAMSLDILQDYADCIGQKGRYLLPAELEIIAYVFNRKIIFYPYYDANPQTFNHAGSSAVEVWFNGSNHFEREPTPHRHKQAMDFPSTIEVFSKDAKGQPQKTKRRDDKVISGSQLARNPALKFFKPQESTAIAIKPPLPAKEYEIFLALIMSGEQQAAGKIISDYRINYEKLMSIALSSDTISNYFPLFFFLVNFVDERTIRELTSSTSLHKFFLKDEKLLYHLAENKLWELIATLDYRVLSNLSSESALTQNFLHLLIGAEICPAIVEIWYMVYSRSYGSSLIPALKSIKILDQHLALALLQKSLEMLIFLRAHTGFLALPDISETNVVLFQMAADNMIVLSKLAEIYGANDCGELAKNDKFSPEALMDDDDDVAMLMPQTKETLPAAFTALPSLSLFAGSMAGAGVAREQLQSHMLEAFQKYSRR